MQRSHQNKAAIDKILSDLIIASEAKTVLLITKDGYVLSDIGDVSYLRPSALAALVAGMFAATREVAKMIGETEFGILLQQGENRHIHISLIGESLMMVVIFEDVQKIGKIRMAAKKCAVNLLAAFAREQAAGKETAPAEAPLDARFKEYALNVLDAIFTKAGETEPEPAKADETE